MHKAESTAQANKTRRQNPSNDLSGAEPQEIVPVESTRDLLEVDHQRPLLALALEVPIARFRVDWVLELAIDHRRLRGR